MAAAFANVFGLDCMRLVARCPGAAKLCRPSMMDRLYVRKVHMHEQVRRLRACGFRKFGRMLS